MKLTRSSREPGGQASNWRPPGCSRPPRPEVSRLCQKSESDEKQNQTNRISLNLDRHGHQSERHRRRRRVWTRLKLVDVAAVVVFIVLSSPFALLAEAQHVEGNSVGIFLEPPNLLWSELLSGAYVIKLQDESGSIKCKQIVREQHLPRDESWIAMAFWKYFLSNNATCYIRDQCCHLRADGASLRIWA